MLETWVHEGRSRDGTARQPGDKPWLPRERAAGERQALADERERQADVREDLADEREREADQRDEEIDERIQRMGMTVQDLKQRTQASIERSRALLARSGETLNRDKERLVRSQERGRRQQAEIDRASAKSARGLSSLLPDSGSVIERSKQLHQQALTVIDTFAASQEQVASIHEGLAASQASHHEEHRRVAEQARATAHRAREILRTLKTDLSLTPARIEVEDNHVAGGSGLRWFLIQAAQCHQLKPKCREAVQHAIESCLV